MRPTPGVSGVQFTANMRYPVSPLLWVWPPLWPFLLLITAAWTLTHWLTWILLHLSGAALFTAGLLSINAPVSGVVLNLGVVWVLAGGHVALYIWHLVRAARRRAQWARQQAAYNAYQRKPWNDYQAWQWYAARR